MNFLEFIEFNLKVQKCLLPQFDLSNAFVSALNDWVKEITECFHYSDLYNANETDVKNIKHEIESGMRNIHSNECHYHFLLFLKTKAP